MVPYTPISPLHSWVRGDVSIDRVGIILSHGMPVPLLEYQAKEAFANVPIGILRKVASELQVPLRQPGAEEMDEEATIAMDLMVAIAPNMLPDDIETALQERPLKEKPSITKEDIDGDAPVLWLMECATRKDAGVIREFHKELTTARAPQLAIVVSSLSFLSCPL